jgi:hypothetical protein
VSANDWICGEQTPLMKGPCVLTKDHHIKYAAWYPHHRSRYAVSETSPRMIEFAAIVNEGLDRGITYSYVEIAERLSFRPGTGRPSLYSVRNYGLGARYTRLRQKIYRERGISGNKRRRTRQQMIVAELRQRGEF